MKGHLTNAVWPTWSATIAAPASVDEYDPPAMERLIKLMKPYIIDIKGVKAKFPARNRVKLIEFRTDKQREQYKLTWEKYEREMELIRGGMKELGRFQELVAMMKFSQSAELIRHEEVADMADDICKRGKAAVVAYKFKESIAATIKVLMNKHGYKRSDISIIWGGMGGMFTSDGKVKLKEKKIPERTFNMFQPEDLELFKSLNVRLIVTSNEDENKVVKTVDLSQEMDDREKLTKAGLKSITADDLQNMKLGTQSKAQRQDEIDRFQDGKSKICLFTFKAGGVGLSLHHSKPELLPRESIIAPCYSAIELVQGLGRAPRLTSLSETIQTMIFFKGTIEEHIADKVSQKLRCLREVVRQRESWEDCIVEAAQTHRVSFDSNGEKITEIIDDSGGSDVDEEEEEGEE